MHFPDNPDRRQELWQSFENDLETQDLHFVVERGIASDDTSPRRLSQEEVAACVCRYRSATMTRMTSSRGRALPPHAAFTTRSDGVAVITELIARSARKEDVLRDTQYLATALFFDFPDLEAVCLPPGVVSNGEYFIKRDSCAC